MTSLTARRRTWVAPFAAVALAVLLAACSSSDSSTSASSPTPDPCAALQTLQTSITSLLAVQPVQQGTDAVKTAVDQVVADAETAASEAGTELAPQIDALKTSVTAMSDTIANAGTAGVAATATALAGELPAVGTAWTDLTTAASSLNCGLGSPSA